MYFEAEPFRETSIRGILEMCTMLGSNSVAEKKREFLKDFDENQEFLEKLKGHPMFTSRCEKCIEQIDKLRNLVQNF